MWREKVVLLTVKQWFLNKTIEKYQMYMPLVIALYSLTFVTSRHPTYRMVG
jgi:hypothetical protein